MNVHSNNIFSPCNNISHATDTFTSTVTIPRRFLPPHEQISDSEFSIQSHHRQYASAVISDYVYPICHLDSASVVDYERLMLIELDFVLLAASTSVSVSANDMTYIVFIHCLRCACITEVVCSVISCVSTRDRQRIIDRNHWRGTSDYKC